MLPQLVNTGFQVLFHSPPGVLFTFPSQYYALSVTKEYLALGVVPPRIPTRFLVSRGTLDPARCLVRFRLRGFHPLWPAFPKPSAIFRIFIAVLPQMHAPPVWALSLSLAATQGIDVSFSSSGYLDVSVHRVPPYTLCIHVWIHEVCSVGFPIRISPDQGYLLLPEAFRSLSRPSSAL